MPIHDWKRVPPGIFHDFHQEWSVALKHALNGILPPPYYALIEQAKSGRYPDVLTFQTTETGKERDDEGSGLSRSNGEILTLAEDPPRQHHRGD